MADEVVLRICELPVAFKKGDVSPLELVELSGYTNAPRKLTVDAVKSYLAEHPELVHEWWNWSGDKRVSSGWYFDEDGEKYVVGRYPEGPRTFYVDRIEACSEFIVREVASIAGIIR